MHGVEAPCMRIMRRDAWDPSSGEVTGLAPMEESSWDLGAGEGKEERI
jgi:hypothetical protein